MIFIYGYLVTAAQCSFTHDDDDYENKNDLFTFQFMLILRFICLSQQELFLLHFGLQCWRTYRWKFRTYGIQSSEDYHFGEGRFLFLFRALYYHFSFFVIMGKMFTPLPCA